MASQKIIILGIESSCDDTAAAVLSTGAILSNVVATQEVHIKYGGVVPELASRAHQQNIVPVVHQAIKEAGINKQDISAIAFTSGPGLMGSLLVGTSFAKSLAMGLEIPLLAINHMQSHILAHFIEEPGFEKPTFPFLALTISGGHTQILQVNDYLHMELIGQTLDDAVGEAFDKSAKILGLPYPGGPLVDKYAALGDPQAFRFPKPKVKELDFSFSGLKTSILYFIQKEQRQIPKFIDEHMHDLCASIQYTIIQILMEKLKLAVKRTGIREIAIAGGVSANSGIRAELKRAQETYGWKTYIPKFEYTTDNAAMIAIAGHFKYLNGQFANLDISATPRIKM